MAWNLDKSEYLFVTGADIDTDHPYGDMDRLKTSFNPSDLVRGRIMPKRQGWAKPGIARGTHVLSGEDMCFLAEGIGERRALTTTNTASLGVVFSRAVKAGLISAAKATPVWIAGWLQDLAPKFVKTLPTASTKPQYNTADDDLFEMYSSADLTSSPNDFTSGGIPSQANVMKLFTDQRKLNQAALKTTTMLDYATPTTISNSYDSTHPVTDPALLDPHTIMWTGGVDASASGGSTHQNGGWSWNYNKFRVDVTLPNIPAALTPVEGYVYINWHFHYVEEDSSGTEVVNERFSYWTQENWWTWNSSQKLAYLWDDSDITKMRKVASDRFGWDPTTMPDAYGGKILTLESVSAWLLFAVDHTDY